MKPIVFTEANGTLLGGPAERYGTDDAVGDLPVYRGAGQVISCWKMNWRERLRCMLHGEVWLRVAAQKTHSPVSIEAERPFA
jgi:hypothetical protein